MREEIEDEFVLKKFCRAALQLRSPHEQSKEDVGHGTELTQLLLELTQQRGVALERVAVAQGSAIA